MATLLAHSPDPMTLLRQFADELEVPDGFRVEIIGEELVVSPTPIGPHGYLLFLLQSMLTPKRPHGTAVVQNITVEVAATGERYVPDLMVYPAQPLIDEHRWIFPAEEALLVVEVLSPSNPENDRVRKLRGYARAHIPLYLLVDTERKEVLVFSDLERDVYRTHTTAAFGSTVSLPEPLNVELDLAFEEPDYER